MRAAARTLALGIVAFACSVGMVFVSQPPASAFDKGDVIKTIKNLKVPPAATKVTQVGAHVATKGNLPGLIATTVAYGAWSTRDTWIPIVKDLFDFSPDSESSTGGSVPNADGCNYREILRSIDPNGRDGVTLNMSRGDCVGSALARADLQCITAQGVIATGPWVGVDVIRNSSNSGNAYCPLGSDLYSATLRAGGSSSSPIVETIVFGGGHRTQLAEVTTEVVCKRADGTTFTLSKTVPASENGLAVPVCFDADPTSIPWETTISTKEANGQPKVQIKTQTDPDWIEDYGDCFNELGLVCQVRVFIQGDACSVGDLICADWQAYADAHPNRVRCKFGNYTVQLSQCRQLKHAYKNGSKTATEMKPDGELDLDPTTGTQPGTGTGTGTNPSSPSTSPTPSTNPDTKGCFGDAFSFNPVDWVYVPVKCSLLWAFKPSTPFSVRVQTISTAFADVFPFSIGPVIASMPGSIPGGSCPNWVIDVGPLQQNVVCDSSYTQAIRSARPFLAAGMLAAAFWPLVRGLFFASVPVLKPTPSDSK